MYIVSLMSASVCLCLSVSICLSPSVSIYVSLSLSLYLSPPLSLCLCLTPALSLSVSVCLCLFVSLSLSLYLSLCQSVSVTFDVAGVSLPADSRFLWVYMGGPLKGPPVPCLTTKGLIQRHEGECNSTQTEERANTPNGYSSKSLLLRLHA